MGAKVNRWVHKMSTLGERIRFIRGKRSREEFSNKYGIHRNTLERWEKGLRVPPESFLLAISAGENVDFGWVKNGDGEIEMHPSDISRAGGALKKVKMGNTFPVSEQAKRQPIDFIDSQKNDLGNTFPILEMQRELLRMSQENSNLLRQNGDLRVEIERLRMDLERRDMHIRDLEREVAELREARKGPSAYGSGVAGSAG